MTDGIAAGTMFAFFCSRTGAFASTTTVGIDLPEGSHWGPAAIIGFVLLLGDWLITLGVYLIGADTGQSGRGVNAHFVLSSRQRMSLQPQRAGREGRINASIFPPCGFIGTAMGLAMMAPAQRHGELITDLAA